MNLGKVYIKASNSLLDSVRLFFGWRKRVLLNLRPYSGRTTVEVCKLAKVGLGLTKDEAVEIVTTIEANVYQYIDMIVVACEVPEKIRPAVRTAIANNWTYGDISTAAQTVYNNIDFQSAFAIMGIMGQLRFEEDIENKTEK